MKKQSKGKLALPRMLQIKMAAHPDIAANVEAIASSLGLTSTTEVVKVALHRMAKELQNQPLIPGKLVD